MSVTAEDESAYVALKECRPRNWGLLRTITAVDSYAGNSKAPVPSNSYAILEGTGTVRSRVGYEYDGLLREGEPSGSGVQRWCDGRRIRGSFHHSTVHGDGSLHWPNGDVYTGELCESVRHGYGTLESDGGTSRYTGTWQRGMRHGYGTQHYADGSIYEGEWYLNQRHGQGMLRYSTGDVYEGAWVDDTPCGDGSMGWIDATGSFYKELYEGEWRSGHPEGKGVSTYINMPKAYSPPAPSSDLAAPSAYAAPPEALLNVYVGEYSHGQRSGAGTFYYADGSCYRGGWRAGMKHGAGHLTSAVGEVVEKMYNAGSGDRDNGKQTPVLPLDKAPPSVVPSVSPQGLGSLLETEEELQPTLHLLLLRYNTTLKGLFYAYCHRSANVSLPSTRGDWWKHRLPGHITLTQCLCLLHDANILGAQFPIGAALRAAAEVLRVEAITWTDPVAAAALSDAIAAVHEAEGTLNYRQFCEWIFRVAVVANGSPERTTVAAKVSALLEGSLDRVLAASPRSVAAAFLPCSNQREGDVRRYLDALKCTYAELRSVKSDGCYGVSLRSSLTAMRHTLTQHHICPADVLQRIAWLKDATVQPVMGGCSLDGDGMTDIPLAEEMIISARARNRSAQQLDEDAGAEQSFVEFVETVMTIADIASSRDGVQVHVLLHELQHCLYVK